MRISGLRDDEGWPRLVMISDRHTRAPPLASASAGELAILGFPSKQQTSFRRPTLCGLSLFRLSAAFLPRFNRDGPSRRKVEGPGTLLPALVCHVRERPLAGRTPGEVCGLSRDSERRPDFADDLHHPEKNVFADFAKLRPRVGIRVATQLDHEKALTEVSQSYVRPFDLGMRGEHLSQLAQQVAKLLGRRVQ